jgi:hypothetical protein
MRPATVLVTAKYWTNDDYRHCILQPTTYLQNRLRQVLYALTLMRNSHYQAIVGPDPSLILMKFHIAIGVIATLTQV